MLVVVLGGARSGKSTFAEQMARRADGRVVYIATSPHIAGDTDLHERIVRHRAHRPGEWTTIEEETELPGALALAGDAFVVVDCLTTWVNNLLHHGGSEPDVLAACDAALDAVAARSNTTVAVSNEVGMGIVPDNELARTYRDLLGRVNQRWVSAADHALLMVAGKALSLHDPHELLR